MAWLLAYQWPVNRINQDSIPDEPAPQPLYYLVYRDSAHEIIFMTLSAGSARLFELISGEPHCTGREALEQLGQELKLKLEAGGLKTLEEWRSRGVILGTLPL